MKKSTDQLVIDGIRVFKASNVRDIHPVYLDLAESLTHVDLLRFIKIYNGSVCASNVLSGNRKKEPVVETGKAGIIGLELLIDTKHQTVQFYSITSSQKGYGRRLVAAVVEGTPDDWALVVPMDWSDGFWESMSAEYPRIIVF